MDSSDGEKKMHYHLNHVNWLEKVSADRMGCVNGISGCPISIVVKVSDGT